MSIRVGIIGAGVVSDAHIASLQHIPGVEVAAIADLDAKALHERAEKYSIRTKLNDHRKLLDDKAIDLVYVCVPHYLHCRMVIDCFKAGKHVVCEKPLSMNAKEAEQMVGASEDAGRSLFIAENHRFIPENILACNTIKAGGIGRPFMCMSCFIGDETQRMNDPANWKGTRDKAGGGVIIDNGFHMIDTLRSFLGEVEGVSASAGRLVVEAENKEEDTAFITLSFTHGVLAELSLTFGARYGGFPSNFMGAAIRYDIYGTEGSLHLLNDEGCAFTLVTAEEREVLSYKDVMSRLPAGVPTDMNRHFIRCLLDHTGPVVTVLDACRVMRVIDACYESLRTNRKVPL